MLADALRATPVRSIDEVLAIMSVAMWKVRAARAAVWTNAEVLWTLRPTPRVRGAFFDTLNKSTGLAGRGLLTPVGLDVI